MDLLKHTPSGFLWMLETVDLIGLLILEQYNVLSSNVHQQEIWDLSSCFMWFYVKKKQQKKPKHECNDEASISHMYTKLKSSNNCSKNDHSISDNYHYLPEHYLHALLFNTWIFLVKKWNNNQKKMLVSYLFFIHLQKNKTSYSYIFIVYNYGYVLALFQSCFICIFIIIHI